MIHVPDTLCHAFHTHTHTHPAPAPASALSARGTVSLMHMQNFTLRTPCMRGNGASGLTQTRVFVLGDTDTGTQDKSAGQESMTGHGWGT